MKHEILILDDSPEIGEALVLILSSLGYPCRYFDTSDKALAHFEMERNALVLLDINMPGKSGLELLPVFKSIHPKTQVIMITGERDIDAVMKSMSNKASEFLLKPFTIESVEKAVKRSFEYFELLKSRENYENALERDIKFGARIQRQIIFPSRKETGLYIDFHPISFVAGNFYHIEKLDSEKTLLMFGGVEGSGVASGFLGLFCISLLKDMILKKKTDPIEILNYINHDVYFKLNTHTISVITVLIDAESKTMKYACAGIPEPVIVGNNFILPENMETAKGGLAGILANGDFLEKTVSYEPNSILFIYNDGFYDSRESELLKNFFSLMQEFKTESRNEEGRFERIKTTLQNFLDLNHKKSLIKKDLAFILSEI